MRLAILAALAIIVILATETRPQERPEPQRRAKPGPTQSRQENQKPAQRKSGTEQRTIEFNAQERKQADEAARKAEDHRQEQLSIDRRTMLATEKSAHANVRMTDYTAVVIAVATIQAGLFIWQLVLVRKSVRDAGIAANAAKESADAAKESNVLTHRARVALMGIDKDGTFMIPHGTEYYVPITLENFGKTPATQVLTLI